MKKKMTESRKRLIKMMRGEPQHYEIRFSVDVRGNITIWGGQPCEYQDLFIQKQTEEYLHLYDGWNHGGEMAQMERDEAEKIPRGDLVRAFLEFRKAHPADGFGMLYGYSEPVTDGTRRERDDKMEVERELRKRNRQYIFEMYGEKLPVDFDFKQDYERRLASKQK